MKTFLKILKWIFLIIIAVLTLGIVTKKKNAKVHDLTKKMDKDIKKEVRDSDDKRKKLRDSRSKVVDGPDR